MLLFDPGCALVSPEGTADGREEIASVVMRFFTAFPDYRRSVWRTIDVGDCAVNEVTLTGTHKGPLLLPDGEEAQATGRRIYVRCCEVITLENGLVVGYQVYFDQLELLAQLGLYPPPAD
ncbi:ester cyclase [Microbispora sp. CA-135349]|uniref:ester cyclase n=1 Tax=Microbispora sp. CA-135349 TaxID=3239953 RepID=UPI003D8EFE16